MRGPIRPDIWWTVARRNPSATLKLLCFPYAGGHAGLFNGWHAMLPDWVEVYGIQYPHRRERLAEPPCRSIPDLVTDASAAIATMLDRPFVMFGHSLGALLCFEVARWLRRHRRITPDQLLVSGHRAPHLRDTDAPLSGMNDQDLVAKLREMEGTPPEILDNLELLEVLLPRLRTDFRLADSYEYAPEVPLTCRFTAFGGAEDEETRAGRLEAWRLHTSGDFAMHVLPGGHFFMHGSETALLGVMRTTLEVRSADDAAIGGASTWKR